MGSCFFIFLFSYRTPIHQLIQLVNIPSAEKDKALFLDSSYEEDAQKITAIRSWPATFFDHFGQSRMLLLKSCRIGLS